MVVVVRQRIEVERRPVGLPVGREVPQEARAETGSRKLREDAVDQVGHPSAVVGVGGDPWFPASASGDHVHAEGMERMDAGALDVPRQPRPYLTGGVVVVGEDEDLAGIDAEIPRQMDDLAHDHRGLARSCAGEDQGRVLVGGHGDRLLAGRRDAGVPHSAFDEGPLGGEVAFVRAQAGFPPLGIVRHRPESAEFGDALFGNEEVVAGNRLGDRPPDFLQHGDQRRVANVACAVHEPVESGTHSPDQFDKAIGGGDGVPELFAGRDPPQRHIREPCVGTHASEDEITRLPLDDARDVPVEAVEVVGRRTHDLAAKAAHERAASFRTFAGNPVRGKLDVPHQELRPPSR